MKCDTSVSPRSRWRPFNTVHTRPFTWGLLPNVLRDIIEHFGIRVVASLMRLLVTQKIFPQVVLGDPKLQIRSIVGLLEDRIVGDRLSVLLHTALLDVAAGRTLRQVFGELPSNDRVHTLHLVQGMQTVYRRADEVSAAGLLRRWRSRIVILRIVKDLS